MEFSSFAQTAAGSKGAITRSEDAKEQIWVPAAGPESRHADPRHKPWSKEQCHRAAHAIEAAEQQADGLEQELDGLRDDLEYAITTFSAQKEVLASRLDAVLRKARGGESAAAAAPRGFS